MTVDQAYFNIRLPGETRNGYRWVQQLARQLTHWRTLIIHARENLQVQTLPSPTATSFMPTLAIFIQQCGIQFVSQTQTLLQRAFLSA